MPLILSEDIQEYIVQGTTFLYERLRYDDRQALQYLVTTRGEFDEHLYNKLCVAVALKDWRELYGKNGRLDFPALSASTPTIANNGDRAATQALLFPAVSPARQRQLDAVLYVVEHLPIVVVVALVALVSEFEPEELKKSYGLPSADN